MRKQIILMVFVLNLCFLKAQIKTNQTISNGSINTSSAFLDASSTPAWNATTNVGKGLVFPRVNLVTFSSIVNGGTAGLTTNYPTRFDGMIVYNTATGTSAIGNVSVLPGFYYYANTSSNVNGGTWVRMNDANDAISSASGTAYYGVLSSMTPSAAQIQALANKSVGCGSYSGNFDQSIATSGYFTLAVPVSWRNPALKIDGNDTWNVFNATSTISINNIIYQVWQTDVSLATGVAVAVR